MAKRKLILWTQAQVPLVCWIKFKKHSSFTAEYLITKKTTAGIMSDYGYMSYQELFDDCLYFNQINGSWDKCGYVIPK